MPTYDYRCGACGHELEIFHSISDKPKRKCPKCGALKLQKQIGTGAGIVFKGSGFYQTDYRSGSYKADEKAARQSETSPKDDSGKKGSKDKSSSDSPKPDGKGKGKGTDSKP